MRGYLNDLAVSVKDGAFQVEDGMITITRALKYEQRLIGYLTMPCTQCPYSEGLAACFSCLGDGMAQCMSREMESHTFNRYMYEYFLTDLLDSYVSQRVAELLPNEKVFVYNRSVLIFVQAEQRLDWVLDHLRPFLAQKGGMCGVSRTFFRLPEIRTADQQASAALRLGRRIGRLQTLRRLGVENCQYVRDVFFYQRYAAYHMVEAAADAGLYSPS